MHLSNFIGNYVTFDLLETAREDRTLKLFYDTANKSNGSFIRNKLIAVDQLGMWIEGFQETTFYYDDNGNKLDEPKSEWVTYQVLVRWEYVQGAFVVDNPNIFEKKMGFYNK